MPWLRLVPDRRPTTTFHEPSNGPVAIAVLGIRAKPRVASRRTPNEFCINVYFHLRLYPKAPYGNMLSYGTVIRRQQTFHKCDFDCATEQGEWVSPAPAAPHLPQHGHHPRCTMDRNASPRLLVVTLAIAADRVPHKVAGLTGGF